MQKLLRLVLLTTIVLLSCSTSWCQNDNTTIPSTGELSVTPDSVLISFDDLRKANAKMVELKYQKEINDSLRSIIKNDDTIMREYSRNVDTLKKQITQAKRQRNIAVGGGLLTTISMALLAIFK
jgi:hypothetical protein